LNNNISRTKQTVIRASIRRFWEGQVQIWIICLTVSLRDSPMSRVHRSLGTKDGGGKYSLGFVSGASMNGRNPRIWLPCMNMVLASGLLFLGHIQNQSHQTALKQANVLFEFDYVPGAFQWLAALYAPCGLMAFPVAGIPGIPKPIVEVWFVVCVGSFWYWLGLQLKPGRKTKFRMATRNKFSASLLNWFGLVFGVLLSIVSVSAARSGAWPLLIDGCGFIWGVIIAALSVRQIRKGRAAAGLSEQATI
jgi:hypothetical protein